MSGTAKNNVSTTKANVTNNVGKTGTKGESKLDNTGLKPFVIKVMKCPATEKLTSEDEAEVETDNNEEKLQRVGLHLKFSLVI